jgi:hypothetical protein
VAVAGERGVQVFSYRQLHASTGGFGRANMVGQGSFGAVYRGVLPDGRKVAVKLMDRPGKQGEEEFEMEVKTSVTNICVFSIESLLLSGECGCSFTCVGIGAGTNFTTSSSDFPPVRKYWIWPLRLGEVSAVQAGTLRFLWVEMGSLSVGGFWGWSLVLKTAFSF